MILSRVAKTVWKARTCSIPLWSTNGNSLVVPLFSLYRCIATQRRNFDTPSVSCVLTVGSCRHAKQKYRPIGFHQFMTGRSHRNSIQQKYIYIYSMLCMQVNTTHNSYIVNCPCFPPYVHVQEKKITLFCKEARLTLCPLPLCPTSASKTERAYHPRLPGTGAGGTSWDGSLRPTSSRWLSSLGSRTEKIIFLWSTHGFPWRGRRIMEIKYFWFHI